jgi:hypothetical protein
MARNDDVTKFRKALTAAGFTGTITYGTGGKALAATVFNDKRKNHRRLKMWNGSEVNSAPHKQKVKLVNKLIDQFGDRLIAAAPYHGSYFCGNGGSVVVKLKL